MRGIFLFLNTLLTLPLFFSCKVGSPLVSPVDEEEIAILDTSENDLKYQVFLLGGTANGAFHKSPLPYYLSEKLAEAGERSSVIFLGNTISNRLTSQSLSLKRKYSSNFLAIEKMLEKYRGEIIFLPGYEDWGRGSRDGRAMLSQQQKIITERLGNEKINMPCHECPGPDVIKPKKGPVIIAMDTQWWLQQRGRNVGSEKCDINNEADFLVELQTLLEKNDDEEVLIVGHHALSTVGIHGGYFPIKHHLFPLTQINKNLWLPLPIIGSIYPLFRRGIGSGQDISNVRYANMKKQLTSVFKLYPNIIYAGGNDESLQYISEKYGQQYLVSGSASKTDFVPKSGDAVFAKSAIGFLKINYYKNGGIWLEAWTFPDKRKKEARLAFRQALKPADDEKYELIPELMPKDSIVQIADTRYDRDDFLSNKLIGENYRKEWLMPVTVPVIDFKKEEFIPVKLGGGVQTKSLRVERPDGTQYTLRSVQKDVSKKLPHFLRRTFVKDWLQDAITATHPYPSLVMPVLSESVGINYAIPKLGFVPSSDELGRFNQSFAGTLVVWEGRPKGDMSAFPNFGSAKDIESTPDVLQKTRKNLKNKVDEASMIRCRLFDVYIGDVDRHDDQWRWAVYENEAGDETYHPIPRDRDFSFPKNDGIILKIAGEKWAFRQAQGFGENIRDLIGVTLHGQYIDRTFITEATRSEWVAIAEDMRKKLTDEVIEKAVHSWPTPIFNLHGEEIISLLKIRREKLPMWAEQMYELNAAQVDVLGSDKRELFEVDRADDTTRVKIYKLDKNGNKADLYYDRNFYLNETKAISLYGFGQDDVFKFRGASKNGILIRAIGGNGNDVFSDSSIIKKGRKKTLIYDLKKGTIISENRETKNLTSKKEDVNLYDRFEHKYPKPLPLIVLGFNRDDIFYIGGGYSIRLFGFRKTPYAQKHAAKLHFSFSRALAMSYEGDFRNIWGPLNFSFAAQYVGPNYKSQYFGMGNETQLLFPENRDYHSADYNELKLNPIFYFDSKYQNHKISIGPLFQYVDVKEKGKDNFVNSPAAGLSPQSFLATNYIGGEIGYSFKNLDKEVAPSQGIKWENKMTYQKDADHAGYEFFRYESRLSLYLPLKRLRSVVASRTGISTLTGEYEFYHSNFIGGQRTLLDDVNLSGYQRNRFAGKTAFFQNIEYRLDFLRDVKIILPIDIGLVGNYDFGRVWIPEEKSRGMHHGYGFGVSGMVSSYSIFMINYTWSKEDRLFLLSTRVRF
ncbi:MAG: hypothetical protein R2825_16990 [Saprospiraceae bacterium]